MNSTFAQILGKLKKNKMSEILKNCENLKEKKGQNSALWTPKNWPGALDHLAIGLVDNARTATGMDGTLTLIFRKSETSRDIIKSF